MPWNGEGDVCIYAAVVAYNCSRWYGWESKRVKAFKATSLDKHPRQGVKWNGKEQEDLKRFLLAGLSMKTLCAIFRRSPTSLQFAIQKLRLCEKQFLR